MPTLKGLSIVALVSILLSACGNTTTEKTSTSSSSTEAPVASKPYQATYSSPGNFAYQTQHFYRDGAGRTRMDISGQGPVIVNIYDPTTNETIMWTEGDNRFVKRPATPMDPLVMRMHAEAAPKTSKDAQDLGEKSINGHNCHGWKAGGTEIWFDNDYGCPVTVNSGGTIVTLTQFSAQAPDPSLFQPPPGYVPDASPVHRPHRSDNKRIMHEVERLMH